MFNKITVCWCTVERGRFERQWYSGDVILVVRRISQESETEIWTLNKDMARVGSKALYLFTSESASGGRSALTLCPSGSKSSVLKV
jgi:hypothetical protein